MQCSICRFENPPRMKFCGGCGRPLESPCPECGSPNPASFNFCGQCGAKLAGEAGARGESAGLAPPEPAAERRQLTVMFCDMVGSTALAERLDPEEWRNLLRTYQTTCGEVIERYQGHIAQYLGDGLLVYFGYPRAHEDDAQRALHAGLGILEAIAELSEHLEREREIRIAVRLGVHTGPVVTGEIGSGTTRERLALGQTPNIAARFQDLAKPGWIVLGATTHELVRGFFTFENLGSRVVKGISHPVEVYRVLGESGSSNRFDAAISKGLIPLVGRSRELELLERGFHAATERRAQAAMICGEAGLGKSRLVHQIERRLAVKPHLWLASYCSPYHLTSALFPLIEMWTSFFRLRRDDTASRKLARLESGLEPLGEPLPEVVPLFANLLSVPLGSRYEAPALSPQRLKQKTVRAMLRLLDRLGQKRPVVFLVEDLHWADPSTLEFLDLLLHDLASSRTLILLTFRPTFEPRWTASSSLLRIDLEPLPSDEVRAMILRLAGDKPLPQEVERHIVERTDGVPLFVEELVRMVVDSELVREGKKGFELTGPVPHLSIPATLQDSLTARLDRLAPLKQTIGVAAVLGREFSFEMLEAVSSFDADVLDQQLDLLVDEGMIYRSGAGRGASYIFRHALIQDAARQSILKSQKQRYHLRVAEVLAERFPEIVETQPELVARHYQEAGLFEPAVRFLLQAGQRALARSADVEAVDHMKTGLALLGELPETPERRQQELGLQITLGRALSTTRGYGAPELERPYSRAREICVESAETSKLFWVELGLWGYYITRAELGKARELADRLLKLAGELRESVFLMEAHFTLGTTHFYLGELEQARFHLAESIACDSLEGTRLPTDLARSDPRVLNRTAAAQTLWLLGYPDKALASISDAMKLASGTADAFSESYGLYNSAQLHQLRGEAQEALECAERTIALSEERGFSYFPFMAMVVAGWAKSRLSRPADPDTCVDEMRRGLEGYLGTASANLHSYFRFLLAESYLRQHRPREGNAVLDKAIATAETTGEGFWQSELLRLKAEMTLASANGSGSETEYREAERLCEQALEVARRQGARSLELRAAMSLARLWCKSGKRDEARELVAGVYDRFTEGFETADLKQAAELIAALT